MTDGGGMTETKPVPKRVLAEMRLAAYRAQLCRSCGHHFQHHHSFRVRCVGGDGTCLCEHYWAPSAR